MLNAAICILKMPKYKSCSICLNKRCFHSHCNVCKGDDKLVCNRRDFGRRYVKDKANIAVALRLVQVDNTDLPTITRTHHRERTNSTN